MISNDTLLAAMKTWTSRVVLNGVSYTPDAIAKTDQQNILLPTRSIGLDQRGTCQLGMRYRFLEADAPAGSDAQVWVSINGEEVLFFTGVIGDRPISDKPLEYGLTLVDEQSKINKGELKSKLTWSGASWAGVIRDLLNKAGIPDSKIAEIHDPGSDFNLGSVYPIEVASGTKIKQLLTRLLAFGGCGLFIGADGKIYIRDDPGWPDANATIVYAFGADKSVGEFGFESSRRTIGGAEKRVTAYTAKGPRRPDRKIPDATFRLSGVDEGQELTENFQDLQTDDCAKKIAEREVVRKNLSYTVVQVTGPLNPNLQPGDSIQFRNPDLGWDTNTPARVTAISTDGDGMTMTIAVGAGPLEGEMTLVPPPVPGMTFLFDEQPVSLVGITAGATVVQVTSTASDPSGFEITSIAYEAVCSGVVEPQTASWSKPAEGADPDPTNTPDPVFMFSTLDGAIIKQIVESSSGEGNELSLPVNPTEPERFSMTLAVAGDMGWWVLANEWVLWDAEGLCSAVVGINDLGPLMAGFPSGNLYQSDDYLASEPEQIGQFVGSISCIYINQTDPQHVLVAHGTLLSRSTDGGISWAVIVDFGVAVNYCESNQTNPNEIRVCAGNTLWIAGDGATFSALVVGPEGSNCMKVASAPWGHAAVFWGVLDQAQAVLFEEGHTVDLSGLAPEDMPVSGFKSCTPWQYSEGFLVCEAEDILRDGRFGELSYIANAAPGTRVWALQQRAPGDFVARLVTTTTVAGPLKLVNHHASFGINSDELGSYRIGYGQPIAPLQPGEILLLPSQQTGDGDNLWWHQPTMGWSPVALPVANAAWKGIAFHPFNPAEFIIWHEFGAFWTGNSGASWIEIYIPLRPIHSVSHTVLLAVSWSGDGQNWVVTCQHYNRWGASGSRATSFHFGTGSVSATHVSYGDEGIIPARDSDHRGTTLLWVPYAVMGFGSEVVGYGSHAASMADNEQFYPEDRMFLIDTAARTISDSFVTAYWPNDRHMKTDRSMLSSWESNMGYAPDYSAGTPAGVIAGGTRFVSCQDGMIFGVGATGIVRIDDFPNNPTVVNVAGGSDVYDRIVSGSRKHGLVAVTQEQFENSEGGWGYRCTAYDGQQWASVIGPAVLGSIGAVGLREV